MSVTFFAQPVDSSFVSARRQSQSLQCRMVTPTEIILTPFRRPSHRWIFQDAPQIMQLIPQFHLLRLFALLRRGGHLQILPRSRRHVRWVGTFLIGRNRNQVGGSGSALTAFHRGSSAPKREGRLTSTILATSSPNSLAISSMSVSVSSTVSCKTAAWRVARWVTP
jgi:hypothetical protein